MKIGGWWRLWMVMSGIYALIAIAITVSMWPSITSISHHPSFIYRLSDTAQKVLAGPAASTSAELEQKLLDADRRGAKDEARLYALEIKALRGNEWKVASYVLEMPNSHRFAVTAKSTIEEQTLLGREYTAILRHEAWEKGAWSALDAFLWWIGIVTSVCTLGLLFRWVYVGFRKSQ